MRIFGVFAVVCLTALASVPAAAQIDLGGAAGLNLYVLNDAYQQGADAEGGVGVRGNFSVGDWGFTTGWNGGGQLMVGGNLTNLGHSVHPDGVFAGGDLYYAQTITTNGPVAANGNVYIGGGLPAGGVTHGGTYEYHGTETFNVQQGFTNSPIDFWDTNARLKNTSQYLAGLTGQNITSGGFLSLDSYGDDMAVFNFTKDAFENLGYLNFNTNGGDPTIIVNVFGDDIHIPNTNFFHNWVTYGDSGAFSKVLFNFPDATKLSLQAMGGSILAPEATLDFDYGVIFGSVMVGQLGTASDPAIGQYNCKGNFGQDVCFQGGSNRIPEPGTLALAALGLVGLIAHRRRTR